MDTFLETVASNAVLAAFMAVAVAVATRFVRRPKVAYWLWMLVLIKLVTPPIVQVPFGLARSAEPAAEQDRATPLGERPADWESAPTEVSEEGEPATVPGDISAMGWPSGSGPTGLQVPWGGLVLFVWLTGSSLWFALAAVRLLRFGRLLSSAESAPEYLRAAARQLAERFHLRRCPEVRVLAGPIPPLLWWASRRTVIVLPVDLLDQLEPNSQKALLAHELAHYRRGDHLFRWVEAVILGLYWWHPVVWWARRRLHEAEEQCCDAWVLWVFPGTAKSYAGTLLTTVEFLSVERFPLPAAASGFEQISPLKRRMEMIVNEQVRHRMSWKGLLAVVTVALAVLPWSASTSPAQRTEEDAGSLEQKETPAADSPVEFQPSEAGQPAREAFSLEAKRAPSQEVAQTAGGRRRSERADLKTLYQIDFREENFDQKTLVPLGVKTLYGLQLLKPEPRGLRIIIPYHQGDQKPNVGIAPLFKIVGDFEITASYELLTAEPPKTGNGVGANLYVMAEKTGNGATLRRCVRKGGDVVYYVHYEIQGRDGKRRPHWEYFPAKTRIGKLRLVRTGPTLEFLVAEGEDDQFRKLHDIDFGTDTIGLLRVEAITEGARSTAETLWQDLTIRAAELEPIDIPLLRNRPPGRGKPRARR